MDSRYQDPSTDTAKFLKGTHKGKLGSRKRNIESLGVMLDSKMRLNQAREAGLPEFIRGNPLGCGCKSAHLVSASPARDGMIEANYHCDANWKNYVVFQVRQYASDAERSVKINKYGELETSHGFEAGELGEM